MRGRGGEEPPEATHGAAGLEPEWAAGSGATHVFPTLEARGRERQATGVVQPVAAVVHRGRAHH